ncbi:MAG TPA: hypothetical protein VFH45_03575 [Acidimicrobiales bacterium]|nr:hypothetical protein [Acidimicrobiales bacterium]
MPAGPDLPDTTIRRVLRSPAGRAYLGLAALVALGFVVMAEAWSHAAGFAYVPQQAAPVLAGVLGVALVGLGLGAWDLYLGRRQDAAHRAEADRLVTEATRLAHLLGQAAVRKD